MTVRLEFFVVAESVSIDQITNAASVFNIIETISAENFPAMLPVCVAFSLLRREGDDNQEHHSSLRITVPGQPLQESHVSFRLPQFRHRLVQRIQGLVIFPGEVRFELTIDGEHAAEHVITVTQGLAAPAPVLQTAH